MDVMEESTRVLLVEQCHKHLAFLLGLHRQGVSFRCVSKTMLDRYFDFWLPLVHHAHSKNTNNVTDHETTTACAKVQLIPPPDVAWLWHCHRLAPLPYEKYVTKRFGCLLEPSPSFAFQRQDDDDKHSKYTTIIATNTRELWNSLYPNDDFFHNPAWTKIRDDDDDERSNLEYQKIKQEYSFDLVASAQSQSAFLWHVSRPHYQRIEYLRDGVDRYVRFLQLSRRFTTVHNQDNNTITTKMIVPTFQIDLVWHTHILWSIPHYHETCMRARGGGTKLHHDDSFNDRSAGGALEKAFAQTQNLWIQTYQEPYAVEGAMYEGEPDSSYYQVDWDPEKSWKFRYHQQHQHRQFTNDGTVPILFFLLGLSGILFAWAFSLGDWEIEIMRHPAQGDAMHGAC